MQVKKTLTIFFMLIAAISLFSCKKFLDVQPIDRLLDQQVFTNPNFVHKALNGVYVNMAGVNSYGRDLTWTTTDVMGQYYNTNIGITGLVYSLVAGYRYADGSVMGRMEPVWRTAYQNILNINLFIQQLNASGNVVSADEKALLLGEAHGLRAFIAFDMLRLFGPVYATDSLKIAIPYPMAAKAEAQAILPANVVMGHVMADLDSAALLLDKDPVRTNGVQPIDPDADSFFLARNGRMNYYAVRLLMARALLYRGNNSAASSVAVATIAEGAKWFPWSPAERSQPDLTSPDRIFSSEVIFGLDNPDMYVNYQSTFVLEETYANFLYPDSLRLDAVYENNPNDYRYRTNFMTDNNSTNDFTGKMFVKYADIADKTLPYRNLQPLMRLSELYYIAAETQPDNVRAAGLLNTVRFNRGLPNISFNGDKRAQLTKEYQKEFWGEGQLFFYYKRINQASILIGSSIVTTIAMGPQTYVVPLPLGETTPR